MNIEIIKSLKERAKEMLEDNYDRKIGDEEIYTIICELENFYTAYEKEKEKTIKQITIVLNLIEKQSKEIEELKEDKYGLEEEVQMQAKNIMICENALCEMQDKIKAKIEYYKKIDNAVGVRILESLLEKE